MSHGRPGRELEGERVHKGGGAFHVTGCRFSGGQMCDHCEWNDAGLCDLDARRARSDLYSDVHGGCSKVVTTSATITLDTSQENINVVCKKQCFQDGVGVIPSHTESMTAGNVLVGGVIGLGVDAVSGAMNKYNDINQFTMVPIAGCQA